jgi:tetratricopeptide (TPR) repeat protein
MKGRRIVIMAMAAAAALAAALTAADAICAEGAAADYGDAVPEGIVAALGAGDISGAIIAMRETPEQTPKVQYLMRNATRIAMHEMGERPSRDEAHKAYQNVAISYHNLYLFLRARGIEQAEYSKEAMRYYRKAKRAGTALHRDECDLLMAALLASTGDREKAARIFSKVDGGTMRGDFETMEYMAAYRAAAGEANAAMEALEAAYRLDPSRTLYWLSVCDDFNAIRGDPLYQDRIAAWMSKNKDWQPMLSVPKSRKPALTLGADPYGFAPQKMMRRTTTKKTPAKKKAAAKQSSKSKSKPAATAAKAKK